MTYGKDFSAIYDRKWGFWGPKMWAFLRPLVRKRHPHAKTWLDLCCGTGSLLRLAGRRGYSVAGVDSSRHQLKYARKNVPGARFIVQDIRNLSVGRKFDVITCMFDSLNYLLASQDLLRVFRRAKLHLERDGIFAFDMNTFQGLEDNWRRTSVFREPDLTLIVENSFEPSRALGHCRITGFVRTRIGYRRFQEDHVERGYRAEEIERLLSLAGFEFKKYDGNSLGGVRRRSGRLLYVCRERTPRPVRDVRRASPVRRAR
jgi:SAM-dependent methyltransferase